MTDYTKLVAAVRDTDFGDTCVYCEHSDMCKDADCIILQAADAIEALQAKNTDIREELFVSQRKYDNFVAVASMENAMLAKQMPKQGEWKTTRPDAPMFGFYYCSICGRKRTSPQDNYCPNCGAKLEVQDESAGSL